MPEATAFEYSPNANTVSVSPANTTYVSSESLNEKHIGFLWLDYALIPSNLHTMVSSSFLPPSPPVPSFPPQLTHLASMFSSATKECLVGLF